MEQKIITEYLSGKSISKLSQEYPLTYRAIQKILTQNNIPIRGGRKKKELTEDQLNHFKEDFENGVVYDELSQKYGLNQETLKNMAEKNGFERKNHNRVNKRIKSDYFSVIDSDEKAYWLGFLFTDGSVNESKGNRQPRVRFQLQVADEEILIKYKECLGLDCALIKDKRPGKECYSVEFVDTQIFNDLAKYNIIPNKTYEVTHLPIEKIPEEFRISYLLGLFDGDGCLTYSDDFSTDVSFGLTSYSESILVDFREEIDKLIHKEKHNKIVYTNAYHINWRGRLQVLSILDILYSKSPIHLKRKYDKYLLLKKSLNQDIV